MMKGGHYHDVRMFLSLMLLLLISGKSVVVLASQEALDNAMTLWRSQNIPLYKLGFTRECFCLPDFTAPYLSIVENDSIVGVINVTEGTALDPTSDAFKEAYTVELLFQLIQGAIDANAAEVTVEYDTTMGFPLSIFIDVDSLAADEEMAITVNSFLPIQPLLDTIGDAQALWDTMGLSTYSFTFQHVCECPAARPLRVEVVNGTIETVMSATTGETEQRTMILDGSNLLQPISEIFNFLKDILMTTAATMRVDFDDGYGYPMVVKIDSDEVFPVDEISFLLYNFTVPNQLPEEQDVTSPPTMTPTTGMISPSTMSPTTGITSAPVVMPTTSAPVVVPTTSAPVVTPTTPPIATAIPIALPVPTIFTTAPNSPDNLFEGPRECSLNEACAGLADNCCPTMDNVFLYCCFQSAPTNRYLKEMTLLGPEGTDDQVTYFASTNTYNRGFPAPDVDKAIAVSYTRNPSEIYDLIYYETDVIEDPSEYISGTKKLYMDVYTSAPGCTEVLLQFDSLPLAEAAYPTGRHARFVAFTSGSQTWERLEFDFLDQPDPTMDLDLNPINALVLFFAPGTNTAGTYFFRSLDSAVTGCDEMTQPCEAVVPKSCLAPLKGEICDDGVDNDGDGATDCEDSECSTDPYCIQYLNASLATVSNQLAVPPDSASPPYVVTGMVSIAMMGIIAFGSMW